MSAAPLIEEITRLRAKLLELELLAKRAQVGSDLERQLAASLLVGLAAKGGES